MITIPDITEREFEILGHSLGIHPKTCKGSKRKKDKKLPEEFYRNRFIAGPGHTDFKVLISLEEKSLMARWSNPTTLDQWTFFVTEIGEFRFRKYFKTFIES